MNILRTALKSISKNKLVGIIIIFQIFVVINLLTNALNEYRLIDYPSKKFDSLEINTKDLYTLQNAHYSDDFMSFYNDLKEALGEDSIGCVDLYNDEMAEFKNNDEFKALNSSLHKGTFKERYENASEIFYTTYFPYNLMNLNIIEGRPLNYEDFKVKYNDEIPILISESFKDVINIGDPITFSNNSKYKVVGFFKSDFSWLDENHFANSMLLPFKDKFIAPFILYDGSDEDKKNFYNTMFGNSCLIYNNKFTDTELRSIINSLSNKHNLNIKVYSAKEDLDSYKEIIKQISFSSLFRGLFILIISFIGISSIMIYSINDRKKEFGIRFSCGYSKKYIKSLVVLELLVYLIISIFISLGYMIIKNKSALSNLSEITYKNITMTPLWVFAAITLFIIIVIFIVSLIPLSKIEKIQPKDLIGGTEQ